MSVQNCGACGKPFDCEGHDMVVCWCMRAKASKKRRDEIRNPTGACVCKKCLDG